MKPEDQVARGTYVRIFQMRDAAYVEVYFDMYSPNYSYALLRDGDEVKSFASRLEAYTFVLDTNPDIKILGEDSNAEKILFMKEVQESLLRTEQLLQIIAEQREVQ